MQQSILVTGANGQLGKSLQKVVATLSKSAQFVFLSKELLDIKNREAVFESFQKYKPLVLVNTAAFTQVDNCEKEQESASQINVGGVANIVAACEKYQVKLIHISTDYVFDGVDTDYIETDVTAPINYYGQTKLLAEKCIQNSDVHSVIIRTSWLFSEFGHNFVKTILKISSEKQEIAVVDDQIGKPTYAIDLAQVIYNVILHFPLKSTLYHFSNKGSCSWFDFAKEIIFLSKKECNVIPISSNEYPTLAKRPLYSILNTEKIEKEQQLTIRTWQEALHDCLQKLQ